MIATVVIIIIIGSYIGLYVSMKHQLLFVDQTTVVASDVKFSKEN